MHKKVLALAMSLLFAVCANAQLQFHSVGGEHHKNKVIVNEKGIDTPKDGTDTTMIPEVTITLDAVSYTTVSFSYDMNEATFAYLVFYDEPGVLDYWYQQNYSNWEIFGDIYWNQNLVALYRRDTSETYGPFAPGDSVVAYVLALSDAYDREGVVYTLGTRTLEASGEVGEAEVALTIYNITDTSCDLTTEMNEHTDHYYFAYGEAAGYAGYTESQIHEAIMNQTSPLTENMDVVLPELDPATSYRVFILPFNIYAQMGTAIARDFTTGNISVSTANGVSFQIYPNPAASVLHVSGENVERVELYNALGQQVMSETVIGTAAQIAVNSLAKGAYIIKVYSQGKIGSQKVVVK